MKSFFLNKNMLGVLVVSVASGCGATVTTPELVSARSLMVQARNDQTAQRNPAELRVAQRELAIAETAHNEDPGSARERDRAYIAERRIRIAMANARRSASSERAGAEQVEYTSELEQTARSQNTQIENTQTELDRTRTQAAVGAQQLNTTNATLRTREQQLADEQQARAAAEAQLAATTTELNEIATVRQEQEDLIITLSGGVLFGTGRVGLLPDAERRLAAIATVLRSHPGRNVMVIGYTDSNGSDESNQQLSLARANLVRDRLAQGAPSAHIEAQGMGEAHPVADNGTAEGRASNRRVEIVLHRETSVAAR